MGVSHLSMGGGGSSSVGEKGEKGDPGQRGTKWFSGPGPPSIVPDAVEGDYYLDREAGMVYEMQL